MALEIIPVWKQITPELETELVDFWVKNKALGDAKQAAQRAKQVACIARSEQGEIVGVSTAMPRVVPRLKQPMFYYRNFITEGYRGQQLAPPFLEKTKQALQAYNSAQEKPVCLGMLIELENKALAAHRNEAQWKEGFTFIGYSPKGLHMRVWYFDGARVGPPRTAKKRAKAGARPN